MLNYQKAKMMTNTKKFSGYSFNKVFEKTNLITIGKVVGVIILIVLGFVLLKKIVAFFNNPFGFGSVGEKTQKAKVNNDYVSLDFEPSKIAFEIDEVTQSYNPICETSSGRGGYEIFGIVSELQPDEIRVLHNYWVDNYEAKGRKPLSRAISNSWCGSSYISGNKDKALKALSNAGVNV